MNQDSQWPFIKWFQSRKRWRVDARTKDGGHRKWFETKYEAQGYAEAQRIKRKDEGDSAFNGLTPAQRIDAQAALEIMRQHARPGMYLPTFREIVNFYLKHHAVAKGEKTVRQVIDEVLESKKNAGKSEKYLKDLRTRLGQFAWQLGDEKIINITAVQVDDYVLQMPRVANTTKNNHRRLLNVLFQFAKDRKYILELPISKQSKSEVKFSKPDILTVEEATRMLYLCDWDFVPALAIGLFAGLRPEADLWKINDWRNIRFDIKKIDVHAAKNRASIRWVDMPDNLIVWLLPYRKASGPICPTGDAYYTRLQKAKEAAGINRPAYDVLRHSFCSYHYELHNDLGLTMKQAGHTNAKTFFDHYRSRVHHEDAEQFFSIWPTHADQEKIVSISVA